MTLVGQTLGEFEILERLGQGGMGAVYKARQLSLKRLVALKTLQSAVAEDADFIARFQQEAVAAAGLSHPNLERGNEIRERTPLQLLPPPSSQAEHILQGILWAAHMAAGSGEKQK